MRVYVLLHPEAHIELCSVSMKSTITQKVRQYSDKPQVSRHQTLKRFFLLNFSHRDI